LFAVCDPVEIDVLTAAAAGMIRCKGCRTPQLGDGPRPALYSFNVGDFPAGAQRGPTCWRAAGRRTFEARREGRAPAEVHTSRRLCHPDIVRTALTVAGSDPSGGAGIQADLKTFHQFGVYGEAVVTLITVQNTVSVDRVECLAPDLVAQQLRAVLADIPPQAIKTGALGNAGIVTAIANMLRTSTAPLVVDPVTISKHGARLMNVEAQEALVRDLLPLAFLITPNLDEAAALSGLVVEDVASMKKAAERLAEMGPRAVLVKGGHLRGDAVDVLLYGGEWFEFVSPRVATGNTHGAGCTYSAAITAELARGTGLRAAVERAKEFVTEAIRTSPGLGRGAGPLNHFAADFRRSSGTGGT
jgi:hydroxymethylpyrimidine/phosphomethylpyrimidine kinase